MPGRNFYTGERVQGVCPVLCWIRNVRRCFVRCLRGRKIQKQHHDELQPVPRADRKQPDGTAVVQAEVRLLATR